MTIWTSCVKHLATFSVLKGAPPNSELKWQKESYYTPSLKKYSKENYQLVSLNYQLFRNSWDFLCI